MNKIYTLEEIEGEPGSNEAGLEYEHKYTRMLDTGRTFGLTPHPLWLSDTGRCISSRQPYPATKDKVRELQTEWEAWAGPPPEQP